jgi:riboflavin kinase/FMN adenylyltransferase
MFTTLKDLPAEAQGCVLAIGNFDGVHRGHQTLLAEARAIADSSQRPLGVLTFEPHPRNLFRPDDPPFRLTTPEVKAERLEMCGVDYLFPLLFNWDFASLTAEQFIEQILRQGLNAAHIVAGYDFHFGQLRKGTPETLKASELPVTIVEKIADEGDDAFSSSAIRLALRIGDIDRANDLLGWEWEIRGEVLHGDKRGRTIGYPTANLKLGSLLHPAYGVYATRVQILDDGPDSLWFPAATNIGIRPMFAVQEGQVEAHILDYDRDLYGKILRVCPVKRLRGEAKFDNLDALVAQIGTDCREVRSLL